MKSNYEQEICQAIEVIADQRIKTATFDKTVEAVILNCEDATLGKYRVKYQDASFIAYSSGDIIYENGTSVYVLIPGNDTEKDKIILWAGANYSGTELTTEDYSGWYGSGVGRFTNPERNSEIFNSYGKYNKTNFYIDPKAQFCHIEGGPYNYLEGAANNVHISGNNNKVFASKTDLYCTQIKGNANVIYNIRFSDIQGTGHRVFSPSANIFADTIEIKGISCYINQNDNYPATGTYQYISLHGNSNGISNSNSVGGSSRYTGHQWLYIFGHNSEMFCPQSQRNFMFGGSNSFGTGGNTNTATSLAKDNVIFGYGNAARGGNFLSNFVFGYDHNLSLNTRVSAEYNFIFGYLNQFYFNKGNQAYNFIFGNRNWLASAGGNYNFLFGHYNYDISGQFNFMGGIYQYMTQGKGGQYNFGWGCTQYFYGDVEAVVSFGIKNQVNDFNKSIFISGENISLYGDNRNSAFFGISHFLNSGGGVSTSYINGAGKTIQIETSEQTDPRKCNFFTGYWNCGYGNLEYCNVNGINNQLGEAKNVTIFGCNNHAYNSEYAFLSGVNLIVADGNKTKSSPSGRAGPAAVAIFGKYNDFNYADNALFIIGNGDGTTSRSNAFMVDCEGNVYCKSINKIPTSGSSGLNPNLHLYYTKEESNERFSIIQKGLELPEEDEYSLGNIFFLQEEIKEIDPETEEEIIRTIYKDAYIYTLNGWEKIFYDDINKMTYKGTLPSADFPSIENSKIGDFYLVSNYKETENEGGENVSTLVDYSQYLFTENGWEKITNYSQTDIKDEIYLTPKGYLESEENLPLQENSQEGDTYLIIDTSQEEDLSVAFQYIYLNGQWVKIGGAAAKNEEYVTKEELDTEIQNLTDEIDKIKDEVSASSQIYTTGIDFNETGFVLSFVENEVTYQNTYTVIETIDEGNQKQITTITNENSGRVLTVTWPISSE